MTGEITLSGQVLPIGGLREKVLAAQRAGISKVIFPRENEPDLEELPEETRKALEFIPVDWIQEVLAVAFDGSLPKAAPARAISRARKAAAAADSLRLGLAVPGRVAGTRVERNCKMPKLQDRARDRASDARPYIERAFKDEQVREDVKSAIATARDIYDELLGGRGHSAPPPPGSRPTRTSRSNCATRSTTFATPPTASRARAHTARGTRLLLLTGITLGMLFNPVTGPGSAPLASEQGLRRGRRVRVPAGQPKQLS